MKATLPEKNTGFRARESFQSGIYARPDADVVEIMIEMMMWLP